MTGRRTFPLAVAAVVLPLLALGGPAAADEESLAALDTEGAIAYSQAAIGREVGDHAFRDTGLRNVHLSDYKGKPLVVNLIYTGCAQSCPIILQTLARAVDVAQEALGEDRFAVVTIGFDTASDVPDQMHAYARGQGIDLPNWSFLSTDAETVYALAGDLGFIYVESPKGFDHVSQVSVLDADGRVYRQVYGSNFESPALVEPLKDLVFGREGVSVVENLIDRVRLFCTLYDPASQRYRFDYSLFVGLTIAMVSLLGIGGVLLRGWLRTRRRPHGA
jgi:protein SCO1/2